MQICEQRQIGSQKFEFFGGWFFDLDNHLLRPRVGCSRHDSCTSRFILAVFD